MTRQELLQLADGTLVYNGHYEAVIRTDCGEKCIEILVPICSMDNWSRFPEERPEAWSVLDD